MRNLDHQGPGDDSRDLARFSEAGKGVRPNHRAHPVPAPGPSLAAANLRLAELRPLPRFPGTARFFGILAEIARRCRAFGHGRAFPPHQTGRDQTGEWRFQTALISDRLHSPGPDRSGPSASSMLRSSETSTAKLL